MMYLLSFCPSSHCLGCMATIKKKVMFVKGEQGSKTEIYQCANMQLQDKMVPALASNSNFEHQCILNNNIREQNSFHKNV